MPPTQFFAQCRHLRPRPLLLPLVLLLAVTGTPAAALTSRLVIQEGPAQPSPAVPEETAASIVCPAGQKRFHEYGKEVRHAFWSMYQHGGETVYCEAAFAARSRHTTLDKLPINIEHVVPQAYLKRIRGASADLHNMWPAIEEVNALRQHWRLVGHIPGEVGAFSSAAKTNWRNATSNCSRTERPAWSSRHRRLVAAWPGPSCTCTSPTLPLKFPQRTSRKCWLGTRSIR